MAFEGSVAAARESVVVRRGLMLAHPGGFMYERDLASSLADLGDACAQAGRAEEAIAAGDEAVGIRDGLRAAHPYLLREYLEGLGRNGGLRMTVGDWLGAASALGPAVNGFHARAKRDRSEFEPGFGAAMNRLRTLMDALRGQPDGLDLLSRVWSVLIRSADASDEGETAFNPAAAVAAAELLRRHAREFPGIFEPILEGDSTGSGDTEGDAQSFGCSSCWGEDANAVDAYEHGRYERYATLAEKSHFIVSIRRCRACAQLFASVFTEFVDWEGGEDAQYSRLVPITKAEARDLVSTRLDVFAIGRLGDGRRHLRSDWPAGVRHRKVCWDERAFTVSDGE